MALFDQNIIESCLRWFGHVQTRVINATIRKSGLIQVKGMKKCRGRPKLTLVEKVKVDMSTKEVIESMMLGRIDGGKEYIRMTLISLLRTFDSKLWH